jgi:hypothetical protein
MLPAHDELKHYAECTGAELALRQQLLIARTIKSMTAEEADAWMALLQTAEKVGGEYDYSRGNDDDDDARPDQPIVRA